MKKVKHIYLFPLGQVAAFDEDGEQVPEVQRHFWTSLLCEKLVELGHNPSKIRFTTYEGKTFCMEQNGPHWRIRNIRSADDEPGDWDETDGIREKLNEGIGEPC